MSILLNVWNVLNDISKSFHEMRLTYTSVFAFRVNIVGKLFQKYHAFVMKTLLYLSYENTYNSHASNNQYPPAFVFKID